MLGAVSEHTAKIWVRTTLPADVTCDLLEVGTAVQVTQNPQTTLASDNTCIITFDELKKETEYQYVISVGESEYQASFTTLGPSLTQEGFKIVYGYGYNPSTDLMPPGTSVFQNMAAHNADLILFLGDFPYTVNGAKDQVRNGHKELREIVGFRSLTSSTPTYGIYDDHDFGPNDCDGTHANADEALEAFKEYWPNPSYGLPADKGIYCSFVVGDVEFFLLDGRYPARKAQYTMLGDIQFSWLCDGLKNSTSCYKVLVSGTQFGRVKDDGWAGRYYVGERDELFAFISENDISGVFGISGDVHRSDISKLPIGNDQHFYDFTPGALARNQRFPPDPLPETMIHSYGIAGDNNMYGEIEFRPVSGTNATIIFRSFSAKNGLIYEHQQAFEAPSGEPVVTNGDGVTNVTHSAAELTGYLVSTGAAPATVHVYWGMTNGFDVIDDWNHTAEVAIGGVGPLTYAVSNLAANTAYYYRFFGTNALGTTWATPSECFSTPGVIPFSDDFEERLVGDVDGQNGWTGSGAVVQSNEVYEGKHAVSINGSQGVASHRFGDGETAVWTDFYVQPVFGTCADGPPAGSTCAFYVDTNGVVVVFDGGTATSSGLVVQPNQWTRFTVYSDHVNANWSLWVNGVSAATGLDFSSSGPSSYGEVTVRGTRAAPTYLDNVNIGLNNPLGGRKGTVFRLR